MTHSMSDVSFRKRVSNVEEKRGKISLTRKKHSEDVGEGLALSSVCCFSTLTCSRWLLVTGSDWLIPKLAFFCVRQSTTLALAYLHLVLLTDFRIAPTGRRQSKEGPDTGWEGCGGVDLYPPQSGHSISLAFRHYLEPAGSIGRPQIDRLRWRQTSP